MSQAALPQSAIVLISLLAALILPALVHADASPPDPPSGGNLSSEGYPTEVQMVSEEVVMTIQHFEGEGVFLVEPDAVATAIASGLTGNILIDGDWSAHVEASFYMLNTGEHDESFDVWFPLGYRGDGGPGQVANFEAFVDSQSANVTGFYLSADDSPFIAKWARWPVTFPAGETVVLSVSYDAGLMAWSNDSPWLTARYVLETGAGWKDSIGQGTLTLNLPFEAEGNSTLAGWGNGPVSYEGNSIRATFSSYEPQRFDTVEARFMNPGIYAQIQAAKAEAIAHPTSAEVQYQLGQALEASVEWKYFITAGYREALFAWDAYERAIELDPQNPVYRNALVRIILLVQGVDEEPPLGLGEALQGALDLSPGDPMLRSQASYYNLWVAGHRDRAGERQPVIIPNVPIWTETPWPTFPPEPTYTPTLTRTPRATPAEMAQVAPATSTPGPLPTSTPAPAPTGGCASGWLLMGLALAISGWRFRRQH